MFTPEDLIRIESIKAQIDGMMAEYDINSEEWYRLNEIYELLDVLHAV